MKIVINSCNGGYFVTIDDKGLPWVFQDIDKMFVKIKEELSYPIIAYTNSTESPNWVKEELEKKP